MNSKTKELIGPEIIEHWYSLHLEKQFSTQDVYAEIEKVVSAQEIPGTTISRVDLPVGSVFVDKREYLRIKQERLCFDICAAPVGVNYFFSYRYYFEPVIVRAWEIAVLILLPAFGFLILQNGIGFIAGFLVILAGLGFLIFLMRAAVGETMSDLDKDLAGLPAIGTVYEKYFRKDTYYRQDMRITFGSLVGGIVKESVSRMTTEKGVRLVREYAYSPLLGDLYKVKEVRQDEEPVGE